VPRLVGERLQHCELHERPGYRREQHIFKVGIVYSAVKSPDPNDPGAPVHAPESGPPPTPGAVRGILGGVIEPELHASITDLGMVDDVTVDPDGSVVVRVA